jgi:hypothetical protein
MRDTLAYLRQVVVSKPEPIWNKAKRWFFGSMRPQPEIIRETP